MTDVVVLAAVIAVAALGTVGWRWREGRVVASEGVLAVEERARVGARSGQPVMVLFTTPTCRNCAAAREVLESVAAERPHVAVAEVDVASQPAVARTHRVLRAPTVLVVGADDAVRARVSGVPDRAALIDALPA